MTKEEAINKMNSYKNFENKIFEHKRTKSKVLLESITFGLLPNKKNYVNYCNFYKLENTSKRKKTVKLLDQFLSDYNPSN
jgi:hypothetical protein